MASIKGILVEIGGDTSGLQKALSKVNSSTSSLSRELKGVNSLLKLDPKNTELVAQKQEVLKENIEQTSKKIEELKKAQEMADRIIAEGGEISQENYRKLQREIINTENKLKELKVEASNWTKAGRSIEEFGNKITNISNKVDKMGTTLTTRLTLPIAGIASLLTKSAIEQETAIQQIDNIYGEASKTIKDFAENTALSYNMSSKEAYKYSQVFGNLIQSITDDQKENAKYTQELLKASSIIASSTGRTMEDVMDRIRSGLLGNTEAIEDLGVNVNVALLESTEAFKKFAGDKSWNQLDFQTQQQIRLFGILEQTTKKYGDEINDNTSSNLQKVTAKFNNLTNKLGKNLLPIANELIDVAEKGIDRLEDLSDEEIENITNITLFVASIGPAIKIVGTLGKGLGTVSKGFGTFSQAIAVAKNNSISTSESVNKLASVIKGLTTPMGLAIAAITALCAAYAAWYIADTSQKASLRGLREEVEKQRKSWNELQEVRNNSMSNSLSEIAIIQKLADELRTFTDENGKVKQGYEDRAQVILNELNKALGTEYTLNGNLINQYNELKNSIDQLIAKKKAEAVLTAYQEEYGNAIKEQAKATETLVGLKEQLVEASKKMITGNERERQEAKLLYGSIAQKIREQQDLISQYGKTIVDVENLQTASVNGSAKEIDRAITQIGISYERSKQQVEESIEEQILAQSQYVNTLKTSLAEAKAINDTYQADILQSQLNTEEEKLKSLAISLAQQTSTIEALSPEQIEAWKNIGDQSFVAYQEGLSKLPTETQMEIMNATGIITVNGTSISENAGMTAENATMLFKDKLQLSNETKTEIDESAKTLNSDTTVQNEATNLAQRAQTAVESNDSAEWGEDMVEGLGKGIKRKSESGWFTNILSGLAGTISSFIHFSRPDRGPLREYEKWMPDMIKGLSKTLDNSSPKLLNSAHNLSKKLETELNNMNMPQIQNFGKFQGSLSNQIIDTTKTVFTTPQIVFNVQELDEEKLKQCFNYINKKFGSSY